MADVNKWSIDKTGFRQQANMEFQMKHLLLAKGLLGIVVRTEVVRQNTTAQQEAELKKRSQKAFSTIVMSINSSLLYLITSCEVLTVAWMTLQDHFEQDTLVNKLILKKQYFRMEMKPRRPLKRTSKT